MKQVRAYLPLVTPLVMIALKKAERLAVAMETRGYGLGQRTYLRKPVFSKIDISVCLGLGSMAFIVIILKFAGHLDENQTRSDF